MFTGFDLTGITSVCTPICCKVQLKFPIDSHSIEIMEKHREKFCAHFGICIEHR